MAAGRRISKQLVDAATQAARTAALDRSTDLRFGIVDAVDTGAGTITVTVGGSTLYDIPYMGLPVVAEAAWLLHQGSTMICIGPAVGEGGPGGATDLDDLTDVTIGTPADGEVLTWDAGTSQWIPAAAPGGASTLAALTDVTVGTPADNDSLTWDAGTSKWVPQAVTGSGGGAVGGGTDAVFYENDQTVTTDYTITAGKNAVTAGPVTIDSGVTVTVPSGSTWTVV